MSDIKKTTQTPEVTTQTPEVTTQTPEVTTQTPEVTTQPLENTVKTEEIKKVKIKLPKMKGETADVFVSVNNYTCVIKRGVEVEVPEFVTEVLKHQEEMLETISAFEEKHVK